MGGKYLVPIMAAGVLAFSPASGLESIAGKATAEAQSALPRPVDYSAYRTVDDILAGSGIAKVPVSSYQQEISAGDVVVFFYGNSTPLRANGRLGVVLKEVRPEFPNAKFIALEYDKSFPVSTYTGLGFESVPDFLVYRNGRLIYRNPSVLNGVKGGGPKEGEEHFWIDGIRRELGKTLGR